MLCSQRSALYRRPGVASEVAQHWSAVASHAAGLSWTASARCWRTASGACTAAYSSTSTRTAPPAVPPGAWRQRGRRSGCLTSFRSQSCLQVARRFTRNRRSVKHPPPPPRRLLVKLIRRAKGLCFLVIRAGSGWWLLLQRLAGRRCWRQRRRWHRRQLGQEALLPLLLRRLRAVKLGDRDGR